MSLRVERKNDGPGAARLLLSGAIDDRADLDSIFINLPASVAIDLGAVDRMNSIGVKQWVPLMARLTQHHRVSVESLSYPLVMQANCTSNLFGTAEVRSCLAPYFCGKCRTNHTVAVSADEARKAGDGAPAKHCPKCGLEMVFDELDGYFNFLKNGSS